MSAVQGAALRCAPHPHSRLEDGSLEVDLNECCSALGCAPYPYSRLGDKSLQEKLNECCAGSYAWMCTTSAF